MKRLRTVNRRGRQAEQRAAGNRSEETGSSLATGEAERRPEKDGL